MKFVSQGRFPPGVSFVLHGLASDGRAYAETEKDRDDDFCQWGQCGGFLQLGATQNEAWATVAACKLRPKSQLNRRLFLTNERGATNQVLVGLVVLIAVTNQQKRRS